jgi:Uri superfamily endonuclease
MPLPDELPAGPGAYALLLRVAEPRRVAIGRLGNFLFQSGEFVYLGSACGPGGLRGRLRRHLGLLPARPHWHIDYLRRAAKVSAVYWTQCATHLEGALHMPGATKPIECLWSQALAALPGASIPAPGFGARDCKAGCIAHLVALYQPSLSPTEIHTQLKKALESTQLHESVFVANSDFEVINDT